jgi:hypothetical protein
MVDVERVVPKELNYDSALPLAIESRNNRRVFLPNNGQTFTDQASNIIRIDINADSMLDTAHSYLQATVTPTTHAAETGGWTGAAWIKRLRIESGGVVLEDIDEYHRLYALATNWTQNWSGISETSGQCMCDPILVGGLMNTNAADTPALVQNVLATACVGSVDDTGATDDKYAANAPFTVSIPLLSGLLNLEGGKYLPLVMMNAGITLEIHLCQGNEMFSSQIAADEAYQVTNVQYIGQLIDLDRSFYDRMRMVMEAQGGVLQLAGTSWRHFLNTASSDNGSVVVNIPARLKSIKSIFNTFCDSARYSSRTSLGPTVDFACPVTANTDATAQFRIGSVVYPAKPITFNNGDALAVNVDSRAYFNDTSIGVSEAFNECKKAWGKIGDTHGSGVVGMANFRGINGSINSANVQDCVVTGGAAEGLRAFPMFCLGYDFESFQRSALESGVNTADRSLPIILEMTNFQSGNAGAQTARIDTYVMMDAIFYVSLDGTCSVSI